MHHSPLDVVSRGPLSPQQEWFSVKDGINENERGRKSKQHSSLWEKKLGEGASGQS